MTYLTTKMVLLCGDFSSLPLSLPVGPLNSGLSFLFYMGLNVSRIIRNKLTKLSDRRKYNQFLQKQPNSILRSSCPH